MGDGLPVDFLLRRAFGGAFRIPFLCASLLLVFFVLFFAFRTQSVSSEGALAVV